MMMLTVLVAALVCAMIAAMPYRVPLQGIEGGKRTLVLLGEPSLAHSHSRFFESLMSRGHQLTFTQAESPEVVINKYGEYIYDNIIIFAPEVRDFNTITFQDVHEFVANGGNVLFAANENLSDKMRAFAEANGVEFDKRGSVVIDHFSALKSSNVDEKLQDTAVLATNAIKSAVVLGDYAVKASNKPVLFKGIGHSVNPDNILSVKILKGNPTSYSADPDIPISDNSVSSGEKTLLVSAIQARNNARLLFAGSLDMFSNRFFSVPGVGNEEFLIAASQWVFGESGVLRFRNIVHHKSDGSPPDVILHEKERPDLPETLYPDPEITRNSLVYRIKDEIVYSMIVEEMKDGKWQPFCADDMQMEFVMLDPYVRKTMVCNKDTGKFVAQFTTPDKYGIFKFRVLYRRTGYSVIHAETQVSLRPFKHNEYERFISSAFPYYASAISANVAFVVFTIAFLFTNENKGKK